jgi:hypothetical protein
VRYTDDVQLLAKPVMGSEPDQNHSTAISNQVHQDG